MAFFIGPIVRWLFADIGLHGTIVVIISIFISVIVGKYLKEKLASAKTNMGNKNGFEENKNIVANMDKSLENNEVMENKNTKNEITENKERYTRTESRRDIKHREREERRQERRERRNRW